MDLEITPTFRIPENELRLSFARSSGPGGQNVNKVSSKAILHFDVQQSPSVPPGVRERFLTTYASRITNAGEVVIHSEEYRDQPKNIQASYDKLRHGSGIQWPCTEDAPDGTARLYTDGITYAHPDACESYGKDMVTGATVTPVEYRSLNPDGKAVIKLKEFTKPRTYKAKVSYLGDDTTESARTTVKIKVKNKAKRR